MPIKDEIKVEKKEASEFSPLPENIYQVELLDVTSEQKPTYDTRNKPDEEKEYEKILNFQFTLLHGKDGDDDLRGRNVWANFVPTYLYEGNKGKNKLYQITEALLGHNLTPEEEAKMDQDFLNELIGKQCRVGVKNKTKDGKTYSNIEAYYKADEEKPRLTEEERKNATVKKKEEETTEDNDEEISF